MNRHRLMIETARDLSSRTRVRKLQRELKGAHDALDHEINAHRKTKNQKVQDQKTQNEKTELMIQEIGYGLAKLAQPELAKLFNQIRSIRENNDAVRCRVIADGPYNGPAIQILEGSIKEMYYRIPISSYG